jgi:hypothetical protein
MKVFRVQSEYTNKDGLLRRIGPIAFKEKDFYLNFNEDNSPKKYFILSINDYIFEADGWLATPEIQAEWINNLVVQLIANG